MLARSLVRTGKRYCSPECKAATPTANRMDTSERVQEVCACGSQFLKYVNGSRLRYCSEECRRTYQRYRLRDNPEEAKRIASLPRSEYRRGYKQTQEHIEARAVHFRGVPNLKLRGRRQSPDHIAKRMPSGIKPSRGELALVEPLSKLGFRHTGAGSRWMTWHDGTVHNPDFVHEEARHVVEYFGLYWHRDDIGREEEIRQSWAEIGYDCTIIWEGQQLDLERLAGTIVTRP